MSPASARTAAVVVAAGSGQRLRAGVPKALVPLASKPLLAHALERLSRSGAVDTTVVVHPPGYEDAFARVCRAHGVASLVPGGTTRTDSVRAGVDATEPDLDRIAIHDAARPLTPPSVIAGAVAAVRDDVVAAAPGLPVPDTLKRLADGHVVETLDRAAVWAVHTPQVVTAEVLRAVLRWAPVGVATDDLGLVERAIQAGVTRGQVVVIDGDRRDLKVTYPRDLDHAGELLASERRAAHAEETA